MVSYGDRQMGALCDRRCCPWEGGGAMAAGEWIMPEGFRQRTSGGMLTISWRGPAHWACTVGGAFALVLCGVLLACFALSNPPVLGACLVAAAGVALAAYVLLVGVCNRTVVRAGPEQLEVRHGPLPCPVSHRFQLPCRTRLAKADVERLTVEEEARKDHDGWTYHTYGVHAVTRDGGQRMLLTGLSRGEAVFLVRELDNALGEA